MKGNKDEKEMSTNILIIVPFFEITDLNLSQHS